MKRLLKSLALILAVLLMLTACQTGNAAWVYMLDDDVMPSGVYLSYLLSSYTIAVNALYEAELSSEEDTGKKSIYEMTPKEILKLQYENMPLADWMVQNSQRDARHYLAIRAKAKELGLDLTQEQIENSLYLASSSMQSYSELFQNNGISESSITLSYQTEASREALFYALYDKGGQFEAQQSELYEYLSANYAKAEYLYFEKAASESAPEDDTQQENDAAVEELRKKAEDYLAYLKEGESIVEATYLKDLEELELGGNINAIEKRNPEELRIVVGKSDEGSIDSVVINGLLDAQIGECGILEADGYFLVFRRIAMEESDVEPRRADVIYELCYDGFLAKLDEWGEALPIIANQAALSRYVPSRIKFLDN